MTTRLWRGREDYDVKIMMLVMAIMTPVIAIMMHVVMIVMPVMTIMTLVMTRSTPNCVQRRRKEGNPIAKAS